MENNENQYTDNSQENEMLKPNVGASEPPIGKRSPGLTFVLILSMIGSGWSMLANLMFGIYHGILSNMMESNNMQLPEEMSNMYSNLIGLEPAIINDMFLSLLDVPQYHYLLVALFSCLSLVGIVLMWKMRKVGFHCYTLAQLIMLLLTALLGKAYIGMGDVMMTLLFVAFYAVNIFKRSTVE